MNKKYYVRVLMGYAEIQELEADSKEDAYKRVQRGEGMVCKIEKMEPHSLEIVRKPRVSKK